jgi:hypothetical protein
MRAIYAAHVTLLERESDWELGYESHTVTTAILAQPWLPYILARAQGKLYDMR